MRHRVLMASLLGMLATSCASTPDPDKPKGPVAVTVKVQRKKGSSVESLALGDTWKDGDKIAVSVAAEADANVYLLYFGADGAERVLVPESGAAPQVEAKQPARLPEKGFEVKGCKGEDRLFLVVSEGALSLADPKLYNAVERIGRWEKKGKPCDAMKPKPPPTPPAGEGGGGAGPVPVAPPPPPKKPDPKQLNVTTFMSRAVCAGRDECVGPRQLKVTGDAYVAALDPAGVAVIELSFKHKK